MSAVVMVLAPLRIEARSLRSGGGGLQVERTGMGLTRSRVSRTRLIAAGGGPVAGVAVAGLAGGLVPGMAAGTVVVADRVLAHDGSEVATLLSAGPIAAELRSLGVTVAVGPIISTSRVVKGAAARAELRRSGAVAVDCETAGLLEGGWDGLPMAALRVIVDTPEDDIWSPTTIAGGWRALRTLKTCGEVLASWGSTLGRRRVVLAAPRSFCAGVDRAIATVERSIDLFGSPVYVRRQIVHNTHVVEELSNRGAVFVEELDEVPDGAHVVFSAHGVAPRVRQEAERRGLQVIDATCPLVAKVHREVHRFTQRGLQVVLIGHAGHDETEGTLGEAEDVILIETPDDVETLDLRDPDKVAYITQTTLAPSDVAGIVSKLSGRFPSLIGPHAADVCYATQNRQDAVADVAQESDLVIVVGSRNSSNAARLVEVAARRGCPAYLVEDDSEIRLSWLERAGTIGITAAASTPPLLVDRVVASLAALGPVDIEERVIRTENVTFPLPLEVR